MTSIPQKTREYRLPKANGFQDLTLTETSLPKLKATEALVKVHAVSLQYRDLLVAKGEYPLGQKENPVPCSDMAGEVVALGNDVKSWKAGDRVCANFATDHVFGDLTKEIQMTSMGAPADGVLTEYKIVPAHALVGIPDHLSYEEASTLPCAALTAYSALRGPIPLKGGDTILVQGTGGVSIFALQFAVASGAIGIATSSSDEKLEVAKRLGAAYMINYKKTPDWDVMKITNGRGVDYIVEVGGPGTIMKSVNAVRYGGTVSVIGHIEMEADVSDLPLKVLGRAIILRGILIGSRQEFENMNRFVAAAELHPVVDKVFSFEDARMAYEYQQSQQHVGKVVIKVSKD
ncbi:NAD-P-binding protein [Pilatotrama ljubarskyi]|nr:NAD-P-binding protein [Pilatotrama ljubarskyi]